MRQVTSILSSIEHGDSEAIERLLPIVYGELRQLAQRQMNRERSDHTLQATALVHEAYMRLVDRPEPDWPSRGYFFAAAAEAMRRILIDRACAKGARKRGGGRLRLTLGQDPLGHADVMTTMIYTHVLNRGPSGGSFRSVFWKRRR